MRQVPVEAGTVQCMDTLNESPRIAPGVSLIGVPASALWLAGIALAAIIVFAVKMIVHNLEVERQFTLLARASMQSPPLERAAVPAQTTEARTPPPATAPAMAIGPIEVPARAAPARIVKPQVKASSSRKLSKHKLVKRKVAGTVPKAGIFKRCPAPGAAGARSCRKDVCNGALGKHPACRKIKAARR